MSPLVIQGFVTLFLPDFIVLRGKASWAASVMMLKNESKELSTLLGSVMNSEFFSKLIYVLILYFVNCLTGGG